MKSIRIVAALVALLALPALAGAQESAPERKPLIGINMDLSGPDTDYTNFTLRSTYADAVTSAGGLPVVLPPVYSREDVRRYVELADGFIFIGGADIDPALYGEEPHETWGPLNARRQQFDFMLMKEALAADKPVLGVCLGMQELTVATGGTLIQDIPSETESELDHRPRQGGRYLAHDVEIAEGTILRRHVLAPMLATNSSHHQAADTTGPGVVVSARSTDGLIEGIEMPEKRFVLGVQWHPEWFPDNGMHLSIFEGLVEAAREQAEAEPRRKAETLELTGALLTPKSK